MAAALAAADGPCAHVRHPSVYWYPTPLPPFKRVVHWRTSFVRALLRRSRHHAEDGACADFFFIPHMDYGVARKRNTSDVVAMFEYMAHRWPWYNRTNGTRHFLQSPCDHGPRDCLYGGHLYPGVEMARAGPKAKEYREVKGGLVVPDAIAPKSPNRSLGYLTLNGDPSTSLHMPGLDIRLPTPEGHVCGPFCGMSSATRENHTAATLLLRRLSPWTTTRPAAEVDRMLRAQRPTLLFFAGRAGKGPRGAVLRYHANRSRFCLHDSSGRYKSIDDARAATEPNWMPRMMSQSTFCLSPLGANEGDSDRYLPSVLYGCIPVWLGGDVPPFADVIDWARVSVRVEKSSLLSRLHEQLGNYSHQKIVRMRLALRKVWHKLLWTRALKLGLLGRPQRASGGSTVTRFNSYLGESGDDDALDTLLAVLSVRSKHDRHASPAGQLGRTQID